jgi:hypothetical protein
MGMSRPMGGKLRWVLYAAGVVFAAAFVLSYATGR